MANQENEATDKVENTYSGFMQRPDLYEKGLEIAETSSKASKSDLAKVKAELAAIWFLSNLEREADAFARCEALIEKFGDSTDLSVQAYVAAAMSNRAWLLAWYKSDLESAMSEFEEVEKKFEIGLSSEIDAKIFGARVNRGWMLHEKGSLAEAIQLFQSVIDAIANTDDPFLAPQLSNALVNKAHTLIKMGGDGVVEARRIAVEIIERFGRNADVQYFESVDEARNILING